MLQRLHESLFADAIRPFPPSPRPLSFAAPTPSPQVIPSVYRLVTTISPPSLSSCGAKAAFYLLSALPEWLCVAVLLGAHLERLFAVHEGAWKDKVAKEMRKGTWQGPYVGREGAGPVEMGIMTRQDEDKV